jgi:hypothetical protein
MTERVDQQNCIKFCFKLGHLTVETIRMIKKAFKDDSAGEVQIKFWYQHFKNGWESVESDPCSGRPATSRTPENVEHMQAAINENRRLTVRELEEDLGITQTIVSEILTKDLGKKCLAVKFVPWLPSQEQKEFCAEGAEDLLETTNIDTDFLQMVITGDEVWVYGYDPETKAQSSQWKLPVSPCTKKAQQSWSNVKAMLTVVGSLPAEGCNKKKMAVLGKWWLAVSSQQCTCPFFSSHAGFFGKTSHHPGLSVPLQPRFGSLQHLASWKAKIAIEREEICECDSHTVHKVSQWRLTAD